MLKSQKSVEKKLESLDRSWLRCAWTDWKRLDFWKSGKILSEELEKLWFAFIFWVFEWKATYFSAVSLVAVCGKASGLVNICWKPAVAMDNRKTCENF